MFALKLWQYMQSFRSHGFANLARLGVGRVTLWQLWRRHLWAMVRFMRAGKPTQRRSGWMAAGQIDWVQPPSRALNDSRAPLYEWFTDATVNACYNAVDRHVLAGRGDQLAIIHDSPVTQSKHGITYVELQTRVASLAGALRRQGCAKGRPRDHLYADGARSAGRRCWPAPGLARFTRWFLAALRLPNWRCGSTIAPQRPLSPPAAASSQPRCALQTAAGYGDRHGQPQARFLRDFAA